MTKQTIFSICLAPFLIVPFALTILNQMLEPYPAIILPSGAWTVSLKTDEVSFPQYVIYVRSEHDEEWTAIGPGSF